MFPVKALSAVYCGKFMEALNAARKAGKLCHDAAKDDASWRKLSVELRRHDWVVYAKQPLIGPAHKAANLAAARAALEAPAPDPVVLESVEAFMRRVAGIEWGNCPHCHEGRFVVVQAIPPHLPRAPPPTHSSLSADALPDLPGTGSTILFAR